MVARKLRSWTFRVAPVESDKPEGNNRVLRFLGSTEEVARDGGILTRDGWETDEYLRNPVFLWAHDASQPPIGRTTGLKRTDAGLEFDVEFADKATNPFADLVYRLYKTGFMRAVSVGFDPTEMRPPNDEERERGAFWVSTRHTLLELSGVPVGADPNALKVARGVITRADVGFLNGMGPEPFRQLAREAPMDPLKIRDPEDFPEGTEFHEVDLGDGIVGIAGENADGEVVLQGVRFPEDMTEEDVAEWTEAAGDLSAWRQEEEDEEDSEDAPTDSEDEEDEEDRAEDEEAGDEPSEDEEDDEDDEEAMAAIVSDLRDLVDLVEAAFNRMLGRGAEDADAGDGSGPRAQRSKSKPGADDRLMQLARKYAGTE